MRKASYTREDITLLHKLRAEYDDDWATIQRLFNANSPVQRSIGSLLAKYYGKKRQRQSEEKVRDLPIY